ncbi:hypothetical protein [Taibaiella koreensis]|uniref:hypothetical protein n=1 Tax=Taibaiella koreensis TaxID=1268548 RepID=UPI000E59A4AC|nr:hypothetical protein [Taibaiella koreensis]
MKNVLLILFALFIADRTQAQRRWEFNLMPELSGYANLNQSDISREKATQVMRSAFGIGGGIGIAFRLDQRRSFFYMMPSLGYRLDPQRLDISYGDGRTDIQKANNVYIYLKPVFGISIPAGNSNGIDVGLGFSLNYSMKSVATPYNLQYLEYTDPSTGEVLRRPAAGYYASWGDHRDNSVFFVPSIVQLVFQTAYIDRSLLPSHKPLRIGLEFATRLGSKQYNCAGNEARVALIDEQRRVTASESYWDRYTSLALSLGIGL